jgi:hypothetical protein
MNFYKDLEPPKHPRIRPIPAIVPKNDIKESLHPQQLKIIDDLKDKNYKWFLK